MDYLIKSLKVISTLVQFKLYFKFHVKQHTAVRNI